MIFFFYMLLSIVVLVLFMISVCSNILVLIFLFNVEVGGLFYNKYCALCYGLEGEGYVVDSVTNLNNIMFLAISSDRFLYNVIVEGYLGTIMFLWVDYCGGPFGEIDIWNIVGLLCSW